MSRGTRNLNEIALDLISRGPAVFYTCKTSGDYAPTFVTDNIEQQLGYTAQEFLRGPGFWIERIHPDDSARVLANLSQLFETGRHIHEYRFRHKDGSYRWMYDQLVLVRDARGEPEQIVGYWTNITERKHIEEALRESEQRLASITDNLPGGVYRRILHADGILSYPYISAGFAKIFDLDSEKIMGDSRYIFSALHPDDRARARETIETSAETLGVYDHEYRLLGESGGISWFRSIARPYRLQNGDVVWDGVAVDITERKRAEETTRKLAAQLERQANTLEAMLAASPDHIYMYDASARYTYASAAAATALGMKRDVIVGKHWRELGFPAEIMEPFEAQVRSVFATGLPASAETHFPTVQGIRQYEYFLMPVRGPGASVEAVVCTARDITEPKEIEERLQRAYSELELRVAERTADLAAAEEQLRLITDALPVLISYIDAGQRYRYTSKAYEDWFGIPRMEFIGKHLGEMMGETVYEKIRKHVETALAGQLVTFESELPDQYGGPRSVSCTYVPHLGQAGQVRGFIALIHDITERKELEEKRLAQAKEQRDTLIKEVHHRIKNNLQAVVGLLRRHTRAHPELAGIMQTAITQVSAIAVVHGLQTTNLQGALSLCDILMKIVEVVEQLNNTGRKIAVKISPQESPPTLVVTQECVPVALILNELIMNAFKHSPEVGGRTVKVSLSRMPDAARVRIENEGTALPAGFDFEQGMRLGVGLALVRSLLPPEGARLSLRGSAQGVVADMTLTPPVIVVAPPA